MSRIEGLDGPIEEVPGVGPKRGGVLREAGICTVEDLFYYFPRRYLDRHRILPIGSVPPGQEVTLIGQVRQLRFIPGARPRFALVVEDETEDITCVWFHGGRYLQRHFRASLEQGLREFDAIVEEAVAELGLGRDELRRYLTRNLGFTLGAEERAGLEEFFARAARHGLLERVRPLRYRASGQVG